MKEVIKNKPKAFFEEKLKEKARKISIQEGSFTSVQSGLGDYYITPFAVAVNSSNFQIGLLSSISTLLGPLSQLFGSKKIEKFSRKKIVRFSILIQALMWIPLIILCYLYYKNIIAGIIPLLLIVFFSFYVFFGNFASPAWFSWMGDIVDDNHRGRYFSKRNIITGIIVLASSLLGAFVLDFFKNNNLTMLGFGIFFFIAMISRLISRRIFQKQYEPHLKLSKNYYFSFWDFLEKGRATNFGKFTIYRALIALSVMIAGPFFAVYMLKTLNFNYLVFMLVTVSETAFALILMPFWGKFSDKFGNYKLLYFTGILISIFPLLWLFSDSPIYLIFIPQLIGGIAWAGFNLATGNFIYDLVSPEKRGIAVSYFNLLLGIGGFVGGIIGALLVKYISVSFMNLFLFIFLISGIARILINLIMLPQIKEIRKTRTSSKAIKDFVFRSLKLPHFTGAHELIGHKHARAG